MLPTAILKPGLSLSLSLCLWSSDEGAATWRLPCSNYLPFSLNPVQQALLNSGLKSKLFGLLITHAVNEHD